MKKYLTFTFFILLSFSCLSLELPVPGEVPVPTKSESAKATRDPAETPTLVPTPQCIVNATALNLRACTGTHCAVTGWVKKDDVLTILTQQNQWLQVETQARNTGWVHSKFCTGE